MMCQSNQQLNLLKSLLNLKNNDEDVLLQFYLDSAGDIINEIRHTEVVEDKYKSVQVSIAVEMYNKMGIEGQISHGEGTVSRGFEVGDVSPSLISRITPKLHSI